MKLFAEESAISLLAVEAATGARVGNGLMLKGRIAVPATTWLAPAEKPTGYIVCPPTILST